MKNIKRKIFQIILTVFMVFSSCFLTGTVEAVDDENTNNLTQSIGMYDIESDKVIDNEGNNEATKPTFSQSSDNEGSNLTDGATEGKVWTNKKIEPVDGQIGTYKVTFQALGFKYRNVNQNNIKEDTWKNPLQKGTNLVMSEEISTKFEIQNNPTVLMNTMADFKDKDEVDINTENNHIEVVIHANDVSKSIISDREGIAFDVEVSFILKLKDDATDNVSGYIQDEKIIFETKESKSQFTPALDNFYYYEWGENDLTQTYTTGEVNWSNNASDFSGIKWIENITIPDMYGHEFKFTPAAAKGHSGDNEFYVDKNHQNHGDYREDTPTPKSRNDYYWVDVKEFLDNVDFESKGINSLYLYVLCIDEGQGKNAYLRIEVEYTNGVWFVLEPKVPLGGPGGHDKEGIDLGVTEIIIKDKPSLRENADNDGTADGIINSDFNNIGQIILVAKDIEDMIDYDKTAKIKDWNERTYDVTINASSQLESVEKKPVDIVLAIDMSKSMLFPSKLNKISSIEYDINGIKNLFNKNGQYNQNRNNEYYIIVDPENKATVYRIYFSNYKWRITDASQNNETELSTFSFSGKSCLYTAADEYDRFHYVSGAAKTFINNMKEIASNSKIGIVTFNEDAYTNNILYSLENEYDDLIEHVNDTISKNNLNSKTEQAKAIYEAYNMLNNSQNEKYIILLTDGCYNGNGTVADVEKEATNAKNSGCTLITMGVSLTDISAAKGLLEEIATEATSGNKFSYELAYNSEYPDELDSMFNAVISSVIGSSLTKVTVKDYIDPRFNLMNGDVVAAEGDIINGGKVGKDDKRWFIEWTDVTIGNEINGNPGWEKTITLKAKDDFLGGNIVPTNGDDSCITIPIGNGGSEEIVSTEIINLPKPTVNVKELEGIKEKVETTYFLGENIKKNELINLLKNEFDTDYQWAVSIVDELLRSGSSEKLYSYEGVEFGKIILTISPELNDHDANLAGNNIESYTLKLEYKPYTYNERNEEVNAEYIRPIDDPNEFYCKDYIILEGKICVNVVDGNISVTKNIDKLTNQSSQGDPIFTFKLEGTTVSGKNVLEYRTVRFDGSGLTKTAKVFDNLEKGVYTITELDTYRYIQTQIQEDHIGGLAYHDISGESVTFYIGCSNIIVASSQEKLVAKLKGDMDSSRLSRRDGSIKFINNLIIDDEISDTDVVTNSFEVDGNGKVTINQEYYKVKESN